MLNQFFTAVGTKLIALDLRGSNLPGYNSSGGDNSSKAITDGRLAAVMYIVLNLFGVIAVLVIIVAGIQYILSSGDPQKTAKAKNTIIYALVGLVIAMIASAIVSFVTGKLFV